MEKRREGVETTIRVLDGTGLVGWKYHKCKMPIHQRPTVRYRYKEAFMEEVG